MYIYSCFHKPMHSRNRLNGGTGKSLGQITWSGQFTWANTLRTQQDCGVLVCKRVLQRKEPMCCLLVYYKELPLPDLHG